MAVVTNPLKNLVVDLLLDEHDSAAFLKRARGSDLDFKRNIRYYAAIGRSQVWNDSDISPTAQPTLQEENRFRNTSIRHSALYGRCIRSSERDRISMHYKTFVYSWWIWWWSCIQHRRI